MDDHLTKETRELWNVARDLVDDGILHSVRCYDGRIKVREYQDGPMSIFTGKDLRRYTNLLGRMENVTPSTPSRKRSLNELSPEGLIQYEPNLKVNSADQHQGNNQTQSTANETIKDHDTEARRQTQTEKNKKTRKTASSIQGEKRRYESLERYGFKKG